MSTTGFTVLTGTLSGSTVLRGILSSSVVLTVVPAPAAAPSILAAVHSWWLATPAAMALVADGKLWYKEQPEVPLVALAFPYATYFRVSETVDTWTTGYPLIRANIQITMHGHTAEQAEYLASSCRGLMSKSAAQPAGAPMLLGSEAVMHVLDDETALELGEGLGPGGQDCWCGYFTIEIMFTR